MVEINDDSRRTYHTNSQIKYKNSTIKSSLSDSSNVCINVNTKLSNTKTAAALDNPGKMLYLTALLSLLIAQMK